MEKILKQLDSYYEVNDIENAYSFLLEQLNLAMQNERDDIVLGLLSELLGYYRVTAQYDLGNQIVIQTLKILQAHGLEKSIAAGTSYLNIATFYRVQGRYQEALDFYFKTKSIYEDFLDEEDERLASFYNNLSLLYQETGEINKAIEYENKALNIIIKKDNCDSELAITYTNLAEMYYANSDAQYGKEYLDSALALFQSFDVFDPHYYAALSLLAWQKYLEKDYSAALKIYEQVLSGIKSLYGENHDYKIVLENKRKIEQEMNKDNGLNLSRLYYEQFGKKMLEEKFSNYIQYMAIGLCGYGSECLGYDDEISRDHDFGPGFCIWLPRKVYDEVYSNLQKEYNALPDEFMGFKRNVSKHGDQRVGVFCIDDFFMSILQIYPQTIEDWLKVDENSLLACTNGTIFEDHLGIVTKLRNDLAYYPKEAWLKKLAEAIAMMAQSGQYNYARCLKRKDSIAAYLTLNTFIDNTLSVIYLLNKKYKPYYKWSFYGLKDCPILNDLKIDLLELIELEDKQQQLFIIEKICQKVVTELHRQHLSSKEDLFLEEHVQEILSCGGTI